MQPTMNDDIYSFGPFRLDPDRKRLLRDGRDVGLRYRAVHALMALIDHEGDTVSYDELALWAWGSEYVQAGTVIVTIREVRKYLGEYGGYIKNIPRVGYCFERPERPPHAGAAQSPAPREVCILPIAFTDDTRDQDKGDLSSGIASKLHKLLSKVGSLQVIQAPPQAAKFLDSSQGKEYFVQGSLAGAGERLRCNVQLLAGRDRKIVWEESYPTADLQRTVLKVASKVVEEIKQDANAAQITLEEMDKMQSEQKVDSETYKMYLRGLHHWSRPTEVDLFRAVEHFRYVTFRQENYAGAFGAMAHAYGLMGFAGYIRPHIAMIQAKDAAEKCLKLSPDSPEGLAGLAAVECYYRWNWRGAEELLRRAITLNPNYDTGHHLYAMGCLMPQVRLEEALDEIRVAQEINPLSPFITSCVGIIHFYARDYDNAMKQFERALKMQPHYFLAHWHRGWVLSELGRFDEAVNALSEAVQSSHGSLQVLAALGKVFAVAGRIKDSQRILSQLKQSAAERYISPYDLALIHIGLGDDAKALMLLGNAVSQGVPMLSRLRVHPAFKRFHSNPQFLELLRAVNLSPAAPPDEGNEPKRLKSPRRQDSKKRRH